MPPKKDLGIRYFSSSVDKEFRQDQRDNPDRYEYRVLGLFNSKDELLNHEIELHALYEVGRNKRFYNRAKQTSTSWTTIGTTTPDHVKAKLSISSRRLKHSEETIRYLREINTGDGNPMYGRTGEDCPAFRRTYTAEQKYSFGNGSRGRNQTEDEKTKRRLSIIEANKNDPTISERKSKSMIGKNKGRIFGHVYHHNDTHEIRVFKEYEEIPEGFIKGKYGPGKSKSAHNANKICITNDIENKYINSGEEIPIGFKLGAKKRKRKNKDV